MNVTRLRAALAEAFGGTKAERRVVARQVRDLADTGRLAADRGDPLSVDVVVDELEDAPAGSSLAERWNWWVGALELAYGDYAEFEVQRVVEE